jgi:hypothetical protein
MKWQYRVIRTELGGSSQTEVTKVAGLGVRSLKDLDAILNEVGQEGWELVEALPSTGLEVWFAFKRPIG